MMVVAHHVTAGSRFLDRDTADYLALELAIFSGWFQKRYCLSVDLGGKAGALSDALKNAATVPE